MKNVLLFILFILFISCSNNSRIVDQDATRETKILFENMTKSAETRILFGHQDDLAYGIGWRNLQGESDVKRVTGFYPSVIGHDIGHIERDVNIDSVPFEQIRQYILETYLRGGVNTISWHEPDPVYGGGTWVKQDEDKKIVTNILPGAKHHEAFLKRLDLVADFFLSLKTPDGTAIPVIFRPFHEMNGDWFWWGNTHCSADEYQSLFCFTVDYLRMNRKVHNLIIAYSPNSVTTKEEFMRYFPGTDYCDIIGFDSYQYPSERGNEEYIENMKRNLDILMEVVAETGKVPAITETGYECIPEKNWWTAVLYPVIKDYPLAYVMVWRNGRPDHYYAPHPENVSAPDFVIFSTAPRIKLQTPDLNLYDN